MARASVLLAVLCAASQAAVAGPTTRGNLLLSTGDVVYEYTVDGVFVQSFGVPYPSGPRPTTERARDLVQAPSGEILLYNGTFDPYLSSLEPSTYSWEHETFPGWSTINNGSYGGIAVTDEYAFVTDMGTFGDGGADLVHGIVRFDLDGSGAVRFATGLEPIDLTLGLDGLLYALYPGGSPGGRFVDVFDPLTMGLLRSVDLTATFGHTEHRALAVTESGELFVADLDGDVQRIAPDGTLLSSINLCGIASSCSLIDIDLSPGDLVVLGDRFGGVTLTDRAFSGTTHFTVGSDRMFVTFATVPAPATVLLTAGGLALLLGLRRRRSSYC